MGHPPHPPCRSIDHVEQNLIFCLFYLNLVHFLAILRRQTHAIVAAVVLHEPQALPALVAQALLRREAETEAALLHDAEAAGGLPLETHPQETTQLQGQIIKKGLPGKQILSKRKGLWEVKSSRKTDSQ